MRKKIDSKYQVKGTSIKNARNYIVSKTSPEFFEDLAKKNGFENSSLILPSTWYPVELLVGIQECASEKLGWELKRFTVDSTAYTIREDLLGIYKFFMRVSGATSVLGKLPQMSKAYSNFLEIDILKNKDTLFVIQIQLPTEIADWCLPGYEGTIRAILDVCNREFISIENSDKLISNRGGENLLKVTITVKYK